MQDQLPLWPKIKINHCSEQDEAQLIFKKCMMQHTFNLFQAMCVSGFDQHPLLHNTIT